MKAKKKEAKKSESKKPSKKSKKQKDVCLNGDVDISKICGDLAGNFSVAVMDENSSDRTPYYIPFRNYALQAITGGIPGGHATEIVAVSQAGKSYLLYEAGLETIAMGGAFMLHDIERAYEPDYGRRVGLEGNKQFLISYEKTLERIFMSSREFVLKVRKVNTVCPILIGVDSYPPIQTLLTMKEVDEQLKKGGAKELKGYREAKKNAIFANLLGEWITFIDEHKVAFVLLNQTKKAMGVMFGDQFTSNADNIIQYYVTLRIRGRLGEKIVHPKNDKKRIGVVSSWETIKNRNIFPFKIARTKILYKNGVQKYSGVSQLLIDEGIADKVERKPKCVKWNGKVWVAKDLIEKHPEILDLRGK